MNHDQSNAKPRRFTADSKTGRQLIARSNNALARSVNPDKSFMGAKQLAKAKKRAVGAS